MKIGVTCVLDVASTLLLMALMIFSRGFQHVCSLPVKMAIDQSVIPSQGDGKESRKPGAVRPRRDIGLVGVNETAAGVVYHVNERKYS